MAFHELAEEVRVLGRERIEDDQHPEVDDGGVERNKAVKPRTVSTQTLHDLNCKHRTIDALRLERRTALRNVTFLV